MLRLTSAVTLLQLQWNCVVPTNMAVIRCSDEVHHRLNIEAAQRNVNLSDLVSEALAAWLDPPNLPPDVPARYRKYMDKLAHILASNNKTAVNAVIANLEVFEDYVRNGHRDTSR